MPTWAKGRLGGKIHLEGSDANAYDQWMELDDGSSVKVITIRVGDDTIPGEAQYIDMTPDVVEKIQADLKIAIPNARTGPVRYPKLDTSHGQEWRAPRRRSEVRVRGHPRRSK